jgi:hypothetical protein
MRRRGSRCSPRCPGYSAWRECRGSARFLFCEPVGQIGVGEETAAEGDCVGVTRIERSLTLGPVVVGVKHHWTCDTWRISGAMGGRSALARVPSMPGSRSSRKAMPSFDSMAAAAVNSGAGLLDSLAVAVGGQPHRCAIGADHADHGLPHLPQKAESVLDRAAVFVRTQIGAVAQELVDQVAIGGMDLHTVEACRDRTPGCAAIVLEQSRHLVDAQRPGLDIGLLAFIVSGDLTGSAGWHCAMSLRSRQRSCAMAQRSMRAATTG